MLTIGQMSWLFGGCMWSFSTDIAMPGKFNATILWPLLPVVLFTVDAKCLAVESLPTISKM